MVAFMFASNCYCPFELPRLAAMFTLASTRKCCGKSILASEKPALKRLFEFHSFDKQTQTRREERKQASLRATYRYTTTTDSRSSDSVFLEEEKK
jgi:hypothetical protein